MTAKSAETTTRHKVRQGECIFSIAFEKGFAPATLWDHAGNKALRELRKDPNALKPGDVVVIPEKRVEDFSRATGQRHVFRREGVPKTLKVQVIAGGVPVKGKAFELEIDGEKVTGTTDGEGWVKQPIAPNARQAKLTIEDETIELLLGHLDPANELSGLAGRFHRLGYYPELPGDGTSRAEKALLDRAVKSFQQSEGLEVTGRLDDRTFDLLIAACGE